MEQEEGFFQHLSDEVLLMIVKFAYDAHDVVLAEAEHRDWGPAAEPGALVEIMSALGLVSRRWRRMACDPTLWRQRHDTVFGGRPFPHLCPPFPHIAWRQAYLAKAKRWWSVRNSRVVQGGRHPIEFAVVEGAPALLDRLLLREKADTVAEALSCLSAQNLAHANSWEVALKVFQAREARGGERDYEEWHLTLPIYQAACWGNVELVKLMLDRRRQPSGLLTLGTAMQLAAREGRDQVVRYFVENELALAHDPVANVQEQSVVLAASLGHAKTVGALLEGYPPDLFDGDDDDDRGARDTLRMALVNAVSGGHVETVRVLVEEVDYSWQLVKTIDLGSLDALLPDPADNPAGSQQGEVRKKWSGRLFSSRWMRTAAEISPALAVELGWLLMAKGFDINSGIPLNALQIAAQVDAQDSPKLVDCLLSMGADPKARGSPGSASPEVLAGLKGNTTTLAALSAAAASGGVTPATETSSSLQKKTIEHAEVVLDAGKKRKAPSPADDDKEAGGGDDGATLVKRRRTEGDEVHRMEALIREWVAERWSQVTAHDWIPHHFTEFYLRAQLLHFGLQPQGGDRVELMRHLAEHIATTQRERQAALLDEDPVVHPRVEVPRPFPLFIVPSRETILAQQALN